MATIAPYPTVHKLTTDVFNHEPLKGKSFEATFIHERDLYTDTTPLDALLKSRTSTTDALGLAGAYIPCNEDSLDDGSACLLTKIAVATPDAVLVIELHFEDANYPSDIVDHTTLYNSLFNPENPLPFIGFNLDRLALQLFGEYGMRIYNGIEISSTLAKSVNDDRSAKEFVNKYRWKADLDMGTAIEVLDNENDTPSNVSILAARAWMSAVLHQASEAMSSALAAIDPINLSLLEDEELIELKKALLSSDRLRETAPDFQKHEVEVKKIGGKLFLVSQQYNSRVRETEYDLELTFENEIVNARTKKVKGKNAELVLSQSVDLDKAGALLDAVTLGKEEATTLDNQRSNFILFALQGKAAVSDNPLLQNIWFPSSEPAPRPIDPPTLKGTEYMRLNNSQKEAVEEMMQEGDKARIVLVHGPPGTGKTSVIAALTQCILGEEEPLDDKDEASQAVPVLRMDAMTIEDPNLSEGEEKEAERGPTVWIVAQSNVAVKNVAEKLVKVGIYQFKLIVSREFHFEWRLVCRHEHIYTKIKENMCVTSNLPKTKGEVATFLGDARVVLCTLSMLTNPLLQKLEFYNYMPVKNVVIDEASQIQLGDLLPLLHLHGHEISRLCLVGDHKQLAPYGQEEVQEIESIFEKDHIVKDACLLKITYRLPKPISNIISSEVYASKLIPFNNESRITCCKWLDIAGEEALEGTSYYNALEVESAILLAKELEAKEKDFRVISPYSTQTSKACFLLTRTLLCLLTVFKILARMKDEGMKWEDKCFNVDSFQGNEADYIIISLVRTKAMGFLKNDRRANVLLTRCKKGMFVLSCRELMMRDRTRDTLLGKFAFSWNASQNDLPWASYSDLEAGREMVDEDLGPAPIDSAGSKPASRRTARAEKNGKVPQPKGKGKKRK
ncbi:hypothetical protein M408DRAFT_60908 [Serendipita vermifera MAFF 305830]|uniref:DNA2/NAM7 helicase-like C-terminal domain-containing protein n=1 Tax=Serendipita vermifera MAFF 305830 TaxID=933852 RepID=A0A0C3BN12_SERVB|nr:hypothetical protein M408DRAFT_60908 [Serendipita vermifera MAFF 305830]